MKIKHEHLEHIKTAINGLWEKYDKEKLVQEYEEGRFSRSEKVKDLQMRFCFDLAHAAGLNKFFCELYSYLNDTNIYTALKTVCPKVVRRY
jgi:hypothetical protein